MASIGVPAPYDAITKEEYVARYIREAIVAGRLQPGERLRQQQLANELGFSPTPVREALHRLVTEGWLALTPHIGVSVAPINHDGIDEVYHLRTILEGDLASQAASAITPEALRAIREVNDTFRRASRAHDYSAARQANFQFHALVWQAANSPLTVSILNSLWARMPWEAIGMVKGRDKRTLDEHTKVFDALAGHSPERAKSALVAHINSGRSDYHQSLDGATTA